MKHWSKPVLDVLQASTMNLRELAHKAGADPKTFYKGVNLDGVDIRGQDLRGMEFTHFPRAKVIWDEHTRLDAKYERLFKRPRRKRRRRLTKRHRELLDEAADKIELAGRQEERLAVLFDTILRSSRAGLQLLRTTYSSDKSKFADNVIQDMKQILLNRRPKDIDVHLVAKLVDGAIKRAYPLSRGILLLMFAKHLAQYRVINALLRSRLSKTRSMYVEPYRDYINEYLQNPAT